MRETIIKPKTKWQLIDLEEIWKFRELFYIFVWRDIKVRYKQTALGILWVIFQPIISTVIFTIFFGNLAKIPSGKLPYSLFVLCGLVFWSFFSSALSHASGSMVANEGIIKKVYFPKIILPLSSVITSFVDFTINFLLLLALALILGYVPQILGLVIFPLAIFITFITAAGFGFFLSSINVKYRDVNYILPFFIQIFLFLTPVIYPLSIVSDRNKYIMAINPMTSVVESVRMVFSGQNFLNPNLILISVISSLVIFLFGIWYFNKTERFFADII
jgi:lipopolysaccharide transport system permease protein